MSLSQVTVIAPATTANLGPGFDVFGLALKQPHDKVTLAAIPKGVEINITGLSANTIPMSPEKNTAGVVASRILKEFQIKTGVAIKLSKGILPGIGLGSSAASAAGVAFGLNHMFNLQLDNKELVRFAAKGEVASAGYAHADNVAAAICGGFVIVRSYRPLEIINLKAPEDLEVCVAYPHVATPTHKTEKARSVIPKQVSIEKLVRNVGSAAALASGFAERDVDLIGASMSDAVVEPERAASIPGYQKVKEDALKAGASGVAISGAGPAMMAIVNKRKANASKVAEAMKAAFESIGFTATAFATTSGKGVHVLEMEKE
jgi:homoserine kinase